MPKTVRTTRLRCEALETREVPATYYPATAAELVAAVAAANGSTAADVIELTPGATYTLTAANNATFGPTGLPVIESEGGPLTIVGSGATIERSTAANTPAFRLIAVESGATLTAENLTLQNGLIRAEAALHARGGAVLNHGAAVLRGATVRDNTAQGSVVFSSTFLHAQGGGIYSDGALTLQGGTVQGNQALGGDGYSQGYGGGAHGSDGSGGGVFVGGGTAALSGVTLTGNSAQGGDGEDGRKWTYRRQTYYGNGGTGGDGRGGGLCAAGGTTALTDCTVTRNQAVGGAGGRSSGGGSSSGAKGEGEGGGIYVGPGVAADWDAATTFSRNTATTRGRDFYRA